MYCHVPCGCGWLWFAIDKRSPPSPGRFSGMCCDRDLGYLLVQANTGRPANSHHQHPGAPGTGYRTRTGRSPATAQLEPTTPPPQYWARPSPPAAAGNTEPRASCILRLAATFSLLRRYVGGVGVGAGVGGEGGSACGGCAGSTVSSPPLPPNLCDGWQSPLSHSHIEEL